MNRQRKTVLLLILSLCLLTACGREPEEPAGTAWTPVQMARAVWDSQPPLEGYALTCDGGDFAPYLRDTLGIDPADVADGAVLYAGGVSAQEVVVLRMAEEENLRDALKALKDYAYARAGAFAGYAPRSSTRSRREPPRQSGGSTRRCSSSRTRTRPVTRWPDASSSPRRSRRSRPPSPHPPRRTSRPTPNRSPRLSRSRRSRRSRKSRRNRNRTPNPFPSRTPARKRPRSRTPNPNRLPRPNPGPMTAPALLTPGPPGTGRACIRRTWRSWPCWTRSPPSPPRT